MIHHRRNLLLYEQVCARAPYEYDNQLMHASCVRVRLLMLVDALR